MARRRSSSASPAAAAAATAPVESARTARLERTVSPAVVRWIIVAVFAVFELIVILMFRGLGGDSQTQTKMLFQADAELEAGRAKEGLAILDDFASRWPGALDTQNFNSRLGKFAAAAGDKERAARHRIDAVAADPEAKGTRADAGEALWSLGRDEEARKLFEEEIEKGDANSDLANYGLGRYWMKKGDPVKAFTYFEALQKPETYAKELAAARVELEAKVLRPAHERAKTAVAK